VSLDLMGEKQFQVEIGSNLDTVLAAIDIPAGCTLKSVDIKCDVIGQNASRERDEAIGYAAAAYLIGVEDPDTRVDYNVLWDRFVPKYTDLDLIDLDTTTADVTPFWEPGEGSFEDIFDMGNVPVRVFGRKKMLTIASPGSAGIRFQPSETPFEVQWFAADQFRMRLNRPMRVSRPTVLLLAMASPAYDDTVNTRGQLGEQQWGQIQYAEATLERSLMNLLALEQVANDNPWQSSTDTLRQYLAPNVFETTAASFITEAWDVFGEAKWTVNVPGRIEFDRVDLTP